MNRPVEHRAQEPLSGSQPEPARLRHVKRIILPLAALMLQGTGLADTDGDEPRRSQALERRDSVFATMTVQDDTSPYAVVDIAAIPWSYPQTDATSGLAKRGDDPPPTARDDESPPIGKARGRAA